MRTNRLAVYILITLLSASCGNRSLKEISLIELTIPEVQNYLLNGQISCRSLVEGYLKRIEMYDESSGINAITVVNSQALNKAETIDQMIANGELLPDLFCVPVLVKDNADKNSYFVIMPMKI